MKHTNGSIEWIIGVYRTGPEFKEIGDPYNFVCTISIQNNEAYLMAAVGIYNRNVFKSIKEELLKIGVTKMHWIKKNNKQRKVVKDFSS